MGTDFTVDAEAGTIFILSTATNIFAGDNIEFTLAAQGNALAVAEVRGLTSSAVTGALKFISTNPAAGDARTEYQFHQVSLKAEGDFSLIGDEFTTMQLTGVAESNLVASPNSGTLTIREIPASTV